MTTPDTSAPAAPSTPQLPARPGLGDVHLFDRLAVLYKYRRIAIPIFIVVAGWVLVDSYTTVPMYRATSKLLIEPDTPGIGTPTDIAQGVMIADPDLHFQTQQRILRGRELARRVVKKLDLQQVPEFNGQGAQPTQLARTIATIKRYAYMPIGLIWNDNAAPPIEPHLESETAQERRLVDAFLARVDVTPQRSTQLVDVTFVAADPAFAQRAANTIAEEYVVQNLEQKIGVLTKSLEWLDQEVKVQEAKVQASQRALTDYQEQKNAGALAENQNIVISRLNQLSEAVTKARQVRIQRETVWSQVKTAGNDRDSLSVILQVPFVQNLRGKVAELTSERARIVERYGEKHPEFVRINQELANAESQYADAVARAAQSARTDYESAREEERSLSNELEQAKAATQSLNRKSVDYTGLQASAETTRTTYNSLLKQQNELRVIANSRSNNVRVAEAAEIPRFPFAPNHRRDIVIAILFGLALSCGVAFGLEYLDDTVKTPEDITRRLRLRFLGLLPAVPGDKHPLLSGPVPHDFSEAFRALRTALTAQTSEEGPKLIAVTSAQPREGKTTTAVNIAMALAVGGSRVLIIDADMRRPSVHTALRIENDRGLAQLLSGQARMREVVQRTHDPNLLVITGGRTPSNPSELLSSDRFRALIAGLESGPFEWVIIDTPPVLAVTDAVIIAPMVAGVTFVIGAEMTRWRLAERAVELLLSSNPRSVAAVLNRVDFIRNKYYYSRYYGHQYKNYYTEAPAA